MNHIETFKQKFFNIHYNNLEKLKTYNTSDNLEELNNIFEIITDFIIVCVSKLSSDEKKEIIQMFGDNESKKLLYSYYNKSLGYSHKEINKYFNKYNLENKKIQLILQKEVGLDVYY